MAGEFRGDVAIGESTHSPTFVDQKTTEATHAYEDEKKSPSVVSKGDANVAYDDSDLTHITPEDFQTLRRVADSIPVRSFVAKMIA